VVAYVKVVQRHIDTPVDLLVDIIQRRPRPLTIHNDDWTMAMELRSPFVSEGPLWYPQDNPPFTPELMRLHLFLTKYGVNERSYLPVVRRGRKYCYLDTKILRALLAAATRRQAARRRDDEKASKLAEKERKAAERLAIKEQKAAEKEELKASKAEAKRRLKSGLQPLTAAGSSSSTVPCPTVPEDEGAAVTPPAPLPLPADVPDPEDGDEEEVSVSVGELLGITPRTFNHVRQQLRSSLRRRYRKMRQTETDGKKRQRLAKLEARWSKIGCGRMPEGCRVDSVETDGIGLRLCLKTPIDLTPMIVPIPDPQPEPDHPGASSKRKKVKKRRQILKMDQSWTPVDPLNDQGPSPVHISIDTGRAKPFVAAVAHTLWKKPESEVFTRRRYYYEMHDGPRKQWEAQRLEARPEVVAALLTLSLSGGLHNCDAVSWAAYLDADLLVDDMLDAEYVTDVERALWKMRMFRWKKASLDRATGRLMAKATRGVPVNRPLVFTVGSATFAPTGPGELPVPTSALSIAFKRAIQRERAKGRHVIIFTPCEFRTTMCCCGCGAVTRAPMVQAAPTRDRPSIVRQSRRLRLCTQCGPIDKLRDRDVQAARNILWIAISMYYGLERPEYLRRQS